MRIATRALCGSLLVATGTQAYGFALDGVVSAGDSYGLTLSVPFTLDGGGTGNGILRVGQGDNDATVGVVENDFWVLLEVATELKDLTYGANQAPGWSPSFPSTYGNVQGSEKWKFKLGGSDVELKLKENSGTGHDLAKDGDGSVVGAATSLDWNISQFGLSAINTNSPSCGSTPGSPTSDADCYANPDPAFAAYEFAQIYELQLDFDAFGAGTTLADVAAAITTSVVHASPSKSGSNFESQQPCLDGTPTSGGGTTCTVVPPGGGTPGTSVPEPPVGVLFAAGLVGLLARRRRNV